MPAGSSTNGERKPRGWAGLFGAHPTRPIERLDLAGLVILLHGEELAALTADTACIRQMAERVLWAFPRSGYQQAAKRVVDANQKIVETVPATTGAARCVFGFIPHADMPILAKRSRLVSAIGVERNRPTHRISSAIPVAG